MTQHFAQACDLTPDNKSCLTCLIFADLGNKQHGELEGNSRLYQGKTQNVSILYLRSMDAIIK